MCDAARSQNEKRCNSIMRNSYRGYLTILGCLAAVLGIHCESGFRVTVSESLLRNINQRELEEIRQGLTKQTFTDLSESGDLSYTISNIRISEVGTIDSNLDLQSGNLIKWRASLSSIKVQASWKIRYTITEIIEVTLFSGSGGLTATAKSTSISLGISTATANGDLSISIRECSSSIGDLDLHFDGDVTSEILNLVVDVIKDYLKGIVENQICPVILKAFGDLSEDMQAINTQYEVSVIGIPLTLDNQFTDIIVDSSSLTSYQKGAIIWNGLVFESRTPITDLAVSSANLAFDLQDDVVNNLLEAVIAAGQMNGNFSFSEIVENKMGELYFNCPEGVLICAGTLLGNKVDGYNDGVLGMNWTITKASMNVLPGKILGKVQGNVNFTAQTSNQQNELFGADLNLTVPFQLHMSQTGLSLRPSGVGGNLTIDSSKVGKILDPNLQSVINQLFVKQIQTMFLTLFNDFKTNYPIELPRGVSFHRTSITLHQGVIRVEADVCYKQPNCAYESNEDWTGTSDVENLQIIDILPTTTTTTPQPSSTAAVKGEISGQRRMFSLVDFLIMLVHMMLCHVMSRSR